MTRFMDARTIRRLCLALALLVTLPLPTLAATIFVDGECTLAQAIKNANADNDSANTENITCEAGSGADTIVLNRDVRFDYGTLSEDSCSEGIFCVTSDITIDGQGRSFRGVGGESGTWLAFRATGDDGSLTIINAKFTNAGGKADYQAEGDVTFQNVEFYNSAGGNTTNAGVFLSVTKPSSPEASSNVKVREGIFKDNRLDDQAVVELLPDAGSLDIYRSTFHGNHGDKNGYVISGAATIRSSTIGLNRATNSASFAIADANLRNVTVAYNRGGGYTGSGSIRNSILYENSGADCGGSPTLLINWIGDGTCRGGTRTYTGPSPDIDDDFSIGASFGRGAFVLEADGDAAGVGEDCEFLDQRGNPFGPNPCDLGAYSTYVSGSGPRISAPQPTAPPGPTDVPDQPAPTVAPVQGWVLFSDREDIRSNEVDSAGVGIAHIIELGFLTALDVWSEVGWGVTACHTDYSNGNFVFLDAAGMPREAVTWPAAPHIDGMACTYIETPGTIVLLRADPWQEPATPTPDPNAPVFGPVPLEDCQLITRDMVNLRAEAWGDVLNIIPFETELTATEAGDEFFKVTFEGQEGWVHRDWVTITGGACGEEDNEE